MNKEDNRNYTQNKKNGFSKLVASEYWRDLPEAAREKVLVQLAEYKNVQVNGK